ncbi:hypothetical protein [Nocardia brasiliensis]|uniref:hypothetical protein n=1 Tax=Nocardia brasiliensis TaxID=37326 RepID=UPI002454B83E|nr:hypothetical protein [Nocardia brasiliensis]
MRKLLLSGIAGAIIASMSVVAAPAQASPPPPSLLCSVFTWPAVFLIEITGGQNGPVSPLLTPLQPLFCG